MKQNLKFDHRNKLKLRVNTDTLKTKTAKSNHVVFKFVLILCISTWCHIYRKVLYALICQCVYEYTVVEWPQTSDE